MCIFLFLLFNFLKNTYNKRIELIEIDLIIPISVKLLHDRFYLFFRNALEFITQNLVHFFPADSSVFIGIK